MTSPDSFRKQRRLKPILQSMRERQQSKKLANILPDVFEHISNLLESGIPVREVLEFVAQMRFPAIARLYIQALQHSVEEGHPFADTPGFALDPWLAMLLKTGEATGRLSEVLRIWCKQVKRNREWRQSLWKSTAYPVLLVVASVATLTVISVVVVPQFQNMYKQLGVSVPRTTRTFTWVLSQTPVAVVAFAAVILLLILFGWQVRRRRPETWLRWRRRIIGYRLFRLWMTGRFCFVIGLLTESGVSLTDGLQTMQNPAVPQWIRSRSASILEKLYAGESLSSAFEGDWDPMLSMQLRRAELSGSVDEALQYTEQYAHSEVGRHLQSILKWVEPALTLLTGGVVAATMLSLYGPMYSLMSTISAQGG